MSELPELIQIIPADDWYARFFNDEIIVVNGVTKVDEEGNILFKRRPGYLHEKLLAIGLFKGDDCSTFIAGVLPDEDSSFEPVSKESIHGFDCLVYLPGFKGDDNVR